jgi:hypothetical protein
MNDKNQKKQSHICVQTLKQLKSFSRHHSLEKIETFERNVKTF